MKNKLIMPWKLEILASVLFCAGCSSTKPLSVRDAEHAQASPSFHCASLFSPQDALDITITTAQAAHMTAQIRAKQLATKDSQNRMKTIIQEYLEEHPDISYSTLWEKFSQDMENNLQTSRSIKKHIEEQTPETLGYPIHLERTQEYLAILEKWEKEKGEQIIPHVLEGKFYNQLRNDISNSALPLLKAPSDQEFSGNEAAPVSTALLISILASAGKQIPATPGAATFYPFLDETYKLPDDKVPAAYPFATKNGLILLSEYQFGGQRNFSEQWVFSPEDCSSSIGKAAYLSTELIKNMSTQKMLNDPKKFSLGEVVLFKEGDTVQDRDLEKIQPGDVFLIPGHVNLIAKKPDNKANLTVLEFNRDCFLKSEKRMSGGGVYTYNLLDEVANKKAVHILRPQIPKPLKEAATLKDCLTRIDSAVYKHFPAGVIDKDIVGDCKMFLEDGLSS